jgi:hypothetical protein
MSVTKRELEKDAANDEEAAIGLLSESEAVKVRAYSKKRKN